MKLEDAIQQIEIHLKAHDAGQCYIEPTLEIALIAILSHYYTPKSLGLPLANGGYLKEQSIFDRPQNPDEEYWLTEERLTKLLTNKKVMEKENKTLDKQQDGNDFITNGSNCPDLTDLWSWTNGKRQQGTITEDEAKQIYDALNTLERHNLCGLKFGI